MSLREKRYCAVIARAIVILTVAQSTAAVEVGFRAVVTGKASDEQVRGLLRAAGPGGEEALETPFTSGADVWLELEPGTTWRIRATAEGNWSPEVVVVPAAGGDPVTLELHPVGLVTGELRLADQGEVQPNELQLRARFRTAAARDRGRADLEGTVDCTIETREQAAGSEPAAGLRLRCPVPAGELDLRLRATGHVSHYYWGATVEVGKELDLGVLALERGASVVGWVETADEEPLAPCHVEMVPQLAEAPTAAELARASLLTVRQDVDERGFFHLAGLVPGSYTLTAQHEGYTPARVENLVVLEDAEAELQDPLVLERPLAMTIAVRPPADPSGRPWSMALAPAAAGVPSGDPMLGRTDAEGRWTQEELRAGSYFLVVTDAHGSRLATEVLDLEPSRTSFTVEVPFVEVEGRVTLGGEPVEGRIFFGGVSGIVSISAKSDEEGNYSAVLPDEEGWDVDVTSASPRIFSRLRGLEIERDGAGTARLDVELPDTMLEGTVVDEAGEPVAGARVLVTSITGKTAPAYGRSGEDGEFSFRGNSYGTYWLEAWVSSGAGGLRSPTVEARLSEAGPSSSTRLVVRRTRKLSGYVHSPVGAVPGARVEAVLPSFTVPRPMIVPQTRAGGDGRFALELPAEVEQVDLLVMAPGFVLERLRVGPETEAEIDVPLSQNDGGTLVIETGKPRGSFEPFERKPYVVMADGMELYFTTLVNWASMNGTPQSDDTLAIPLLPPQIYTVCWPDGRTRSENSCESGFLPAGGELALRRDAL